MVDLDYTDDLALPANSHAKAEYMLHSLEQAAEGMGCYMNSNKTELTCLKQDRTISILSGKPQKFVDQFTYLGSNISSTESDVNMFLANKWTAFYRLSSKWKSDLPDKIKRDFFQAVYGCSTKTHKIYTKKIIDGKCARILLTAFHKSWKILQKQKLYDHLPLISQTI